MATYRFESPPDEETAAAIAAALSLLESASEDLRVTPRWAHAGRVEAHENRYPRLALDRRGDRIQYPSRRHT